MARAVEQPTRASTRPDSNLALDLVRVTEAAAMGAGRWIGRGDKIISFGGKKITSEDALRFAVDAKKPGDVVSVTFLRNGKSRTVTVTLVTRPASPN